MGFPELAVVVNRQSPPGGVNHVRRVQERMIQECPHCFPGADYDTLASEDTIDKIHLSASGATKGRAPLGGDAERGFSSRQRRPFSQKARHRERIRCRESPDDPCNSQQTRHVVFTLMEAATAKNLSHPVKGRYPRPMPEQATQSETSHAQEQPVQYHVSHAKYHCASVDSNCHSTPMWG